MNKPTLPDAETAKGVEPTRGIGDNKPPAFDQEILDSEVKNFAAFMKASKVWLNLEKIENEEQAEKAADMIDGLRKLYKNIDDARKDQKKPHDDAGKLVQAAFLPYLKKIDEASKKLKPKLATYIDARTKREEEQKAKLAEEARLKEEQAAERARLAEMEGDVSAQVEAEEEQKAAEKEQKDAARPVKRSVGSASGGGRAISMRTVWDVEVTNARVVFMRYSDRPEMIEALKAIAAAEVRSKDFNPKTMSIPGVKLTSRKVAA